MFIKKAFDVAMLKRKLLLYIAYKHPMFDSVVYKHPMFDSVVYKHPMFDSVSGVIKPHF